MALTKNGVSCDYCGLFISYADYEAGRAVHHLVTPDSHFSEEAFESYHIECKLAEQRREDDAAEDARWNFEPREPQ